MKTAYILSLSAVAALTSLIAASGCSAPAAGKDVTDAKAQTQGDEAEKTEAAGRPASSAPAGATTAPTTNTTTSPQPSEEACMACLATTGKMGEVIKCAKVAKDEAAKDKCYEDICGADTAACDADEAKCADKCGAPPTDDQIAAFEKCVSGNAKAKAMIECEKKCEDEACWTGCFESSGCAQDEACGELVQKCAEGG